MVLDISKMLINAYKPLSTLPGLIPRSFKLTCTHQHAHIWWPGGMSSCPPTPAAPCNPPMPQQVGVGSCGGLPRCLPSGQVLAALPVLPELRALQGVSGGGTPGFDECCFHVKISSPLTN